MLRLFAAEKFAVYQLQANVTRNACCWRGASHLLFVLYARRSTSDALRDTKRADGPRYPAAIGVSSRQIYLCIANRSDQIESARKRSERRGRTRSDWIRDPAGEFAILDDRCETRRFPGSAASRSRFDHLSIGASATDPVTNNEHSLTVLRNFHVSHKILWGNAETWIFFVMFFVICCYMVNNKKLFDTTLNDAYITCMCFTNLHKFREGFDETRLSLLPVIFERRRTL